MLQAKKIGTFQTAQDIGGQGIKIVKVFASKDGITVIGFMGPKPQIGWSSGVDKFAALAHKAAIQGQLYRHVPAKTSGELSFKIYDRDGNIYPIERELKARRIIDIDAAFPKEGISTLSVLAGMKDRTYKVFTLNAMDLTVIAQSEVQSSTQIAICRQTGTIAIIDKDGYLLVSYGGKGEFSLYDNGIQAVRFVRGMMVVGDKNGNTVWYNTEIGPKAIGQGTILEQPDRTRLQGITTKGDKVYGVYERYTGTDDDTGQTWVLSELPNIPPIQVAI